MADVVDAETRSRMMAGIRGRNTGPEVSLRKSLHQAGFRFRLHPGKLPGRPDIVLPRHRAAIFVHGCFWHRHGGCRFASAPKTNERFWQDKFARNVERDAENVNRLVEAGWRVCVVWECAIRKTGGAQIADQIAAWLSGGGGNIEIG